jgi:hypothetical protein
LQLYGYEVDPREAEKLNRCSQLRAGVWESIAERLKGSGMKKIAKTQKASTDNIYYVSAADVADKIIGRMQRGLDPLLFSSSPLALISEGPWLRTQVPRKLD